MFRTNYYYEYLFSCTYLYNVIYVYDVLIKNREKEKRERESRNPFHLSWTFILVIKTDNSCILKIFI